MSTQSTQYRNYNRQLLFTLLSVILIVGCHFQLSSPKQDEQSHVFKSNCQVVKHDLGKSCIPNHPQRVIALDDTMMEILLALDLKPIAATEAYLAGSKRATLGKKAEGIENLGKTSQPNLEKIVTLNPDLILGFYLSPQEYKLLSQIAPTYTIDYNQTGWKETLLTIAKAIGKLEKAEKIIIEYQQRIQKIRNLIAEQQNFKTVSVSRFYAAHIPEYRNKYSFPMSILTEIGLSLPEKQNLIITTPDYPYVSVSIETVYLLDADILFIALDRDAEDNFYRFQRNPLWQTLNVVKKNQVYQVNSGYWIFGNILSANAILDDIEKYILANNI